MTKEKSHPTKPPRPGGQQDAIQEANFVRGKTKDSF